jgi:protein-disulfide isomerase
VADTDKVGLGIAIVSIAAGFGAGVTTGRVAAHLVEEDFARVAAETRSRSSVPFGATGRGDEERHKMPVTRSQPAQGPSDALVTIVEWCELYGESCRTADRLLTAALVRYPLEVRRVFRHVAAPSAAAERGHELACLAEENDKFWALRERLSELDEAPDLAELRDCARGVGLDEAAIDRALARREHAGDLAIDRSFAESFGVHRGPVIYVNGRRLEGELDAESLDALIQDELEHAHDLLTNGAPRDRIYAEIIKQAASPSPRFGSM